MSKPIIIVLIAVWAAIAVVSCVADEKSETAARPEGPHFTHKEHLERGLECSD